MYNNNNNNKNDSEESKKLLNEAYNCKPKDLNMILKKIALELEKNPDNQTALQAKIIVTSKIAFKNK